MAQTASHILVQTLYDWGVRVVFGLPGDGINGIIEAFRIPEPVHHTPPLTVA
jgi:pyruvate dehydrogenase (quinone)|tara:strand:+ start:314 stop:469 length:156 start_codon:yes stop_codon:yes gene_type:complete